MFIASILSNSAWTGHSEVRSISIAHFASFQRHKLGAKYIQEGTFAIEMSFDFSPITLGIDKN